MAKTMVKYQVADDDRHPLEVDTDDPTAIAQALWESCRWLGLTERGQAVKNLDDFMKWQAETERQWSGTTIRSDCPANFVADLLAAGFLKPIQ